MRDLYLGLPVTLIIMGVGMALSYVWDWAKRELSWRKCVKSAKKRDLI